MDFTSLIDHILDDDRVPGSQNHPDVTLRKKRMMRKNGFADEPASTADTHHMLEIEVFRIEIDALEVRLDIGWTRCEDETHLVERDRLEDHWIMLLGRYKAVCDQLSTGKAA